MTNATPPQLGVSQRVQDLRFTLLKKHDAALYLSTDQVLNIFRKAIRSDDGNAFVLVSDFFVVVLPTT